MTAVERVSSGDGTPCAQCGARFRQPKTAGRPRVYCSDACKQKAYEGRRAASVMTKSERDELAKVARMQAKVAKADIEQRQRDLLADVEGQLAAQYSAQHEAWEELVAEAKLAVDAVDAEIARRAAEMGVPEQFRPSIGLDYYSRGGNGMASRRAELRKVAQTRLEADARKAKVEVDRRTAEICIQLASGGLSSPEAREFLDAMPRVDELLPNLRMPELDTVRRTPELRMIEGEPAEDWQDGP